MNRVEIASLIAARIARESDALSSAYAASGPIPYIVIDDLLPDDLARGIAAAFPDASGMVFKDTLRERKYISSDMDAHAPLVKEALFAFHDKSIVSAMEHITGHKPLHADPQLYAGGISSMKHECFLNPHIDNSHDKNRVLWRSLNLLYYISPGWKPDFGGHLELWPGGMRKPQTTIESRFNRLVVMATHHLSLHSVSPVRVDAARNCISNYYFSETPMHPAQRFHITAFRGRPEQKLRDLVLRGDAILRMGLRRLRKGGFFSTGHWYNKSSQP
ncbi:MAG: 2OG-Fe(II) oxygenase [Alphaproteobacteria bacterium]|nr:2OG-Fe(II) oxygenase [Alphaproteobacteria bacterium]